MSCQTETDFKNASGDWKSCRWVRDTDGAICHYEYKKTPDKNSWEVFKDCSALLKDPTFSTFSGTKTFTSGHGNNKCGINILSADQSHSGDWTCSLDQCKNDTLGFCQNKTGITVQDKINVQVITLTKCKQMLP